MLEINQLTELVIGMAIDVHRVLGPGLSEVAYERALAMELAEAAVPFQRQIGIPVV